jgi:hypothetical protein
MLFFSNRVSIEELQKHTELDTERENEFTVEEVRVCHLVLLPINKVAFRPKIFSEKRRYIPGKGCTTHVNVPDHL